MCLCAPPYKIKIVWLLVAVLVFAGELRAQTNLSGSQSRLQAMFMTSVDVRPLKIGKQDPEKAILDLARQTVHRYESDPKAYPKQDMLSVAVAYGCLGQVDQAEVLLKEILKAKPEEMLVLRWLGVINYDHGNFADAEDYFKKSIAKGDLHVLEQLGNHYVNTKDLEKLRKLVPALMDHKDTYTNLVETLVAYTQIEEPAKNDLFIQLAKDRTDDQILNPPGRDNSDKDAMIANYILGFWNSGDHKRALRIQSLVADKSDLAVDTLAKPEDRRKEVISAYEKDPSAWASDELLVVALAYALGNEFDKAQPVYNQFLKVRPDNKRALRGLGLIKVSQKDYPAAATYLKRAWILGDAPSVLQLALCYTSLGDYEGLKSLVPDLMKRKEEDINMVTCLIIYAIYEKSPDKAVFIKAVDGLSDDKLLSNPGMMNVAIAGFKTFGFEERARVLQEKFDKQKQ